MSNSKSLVNFIVAVVLISGTTLICRQAISSARSQVDPSTDESKPVKKSDQQFLKSVKDEIGDANAYFVEILGRKSGTGTVLGVHVSQASPALRKHLKLPHQFGLLIEHVEANSAAADAKLRRFDVLYKMDDQMLVNREQLTALVRMHKPDDSVSVMIFREGESILLDVVLKSGPIADESGADWDVSAIHQSELMNHATNPKFQNCHSCHVNPHPF